MKTRLVIFLSAMLCTGIFTVQAQQYVVLVRASNGESVVYNDLQEAYDAAVDYDALYLTAGNFPGLTINKPIKIYGAGHNPNSENGVTKMSMVACIAGSEHCFITGIQFNENSSIKETSFVLVKRCRFEKIFYIASGGLLTTDCLIEECIFNDQIYINSSIIAAFRNVFNNCVFTKSKISADNTTFAHCIFYNYVYLVSVDSKFKYNIFLNSNPVRADQSSNDYINNIFLTDYNFPVGLNTGSDNIYVADRSTIFANEVNTEGFDYANDYTYMLSHTGTDGLPIGPNFSDQPNGGLKAIICPKHLSYSIKQ